MELSYDVIFGAAGILAVAIPFVIQALKNWVKLPKEAAPAVAFLLGAGAGAAAHYLGLVPVMTLLQLLGAGAIIGGSSTGLYDLKKIFKLM